MLTRRDLFKLGATAAGALTLSQLSATLAGGGTAARRLIIVLAYGGWDTTYLFDPKPASPDVATASGDWQTYGGLDLWRADGMAQTHGFFDNWGSLCAVVNGVAVNSLVHEECVKRVLTGGSAPDVPDLGSLVASAAGSDRPLPYLTRGGNAHTAGFESQAGMMGWANQLTSVSVPGLAYPAPGGFAANPGFRPDPAEDDAVRAYLAASGERLSPRATGVGDAARLADYADSLDRAYRIRDAAATGFLSDPVLFESIDPWPHAIAALDQSFSHAVYIEDDGYWDTHFRNADQAPLYNNLFTGLDALLTGLMDSGNLRDTIVLVMSEMGRTPVLNDGGGKDHWPFTSALVIGENVQNTVIRGTDDRLQPVAIDPATGAPDPVGTPLVAADVLATVASLTGLNGREIYPGAEVIDALIG